MTFDNPYSINALTAPGYDNRQRQRSHGKRYRKEYHKDSADTSPQSPESPYLASRRLPTEIGFKASGPRYTSCSATLAVLLLAPPNTFAAGNVPTPVSRPNILFAVADDWSYGHAGAYGCHWVKTPAFDRLAEQGILFTHAYTPNAKCAPSRACILTGRNPWQLKAAANHVCYFPPEFKTYAEALGEQGYFVGMTAKGWAPGVANDAAGRPRQMAGRPFDRHRPSRRPRKSATTTMPPTSPTSSMRRPKDRPWCFWYGGHEPHRGYEYGSGVAKGGKKLTDIDRVPGCWPDNERVRNDLLDYAFEVEHFDRHLGRMLALLAQRGLLDNTLVVATSDNGMPFPHDKGQAYHDANHLPLAIMWKQGIRKPGRVVNDYVSFIDFAPTFIELAGVPWARTGMAPAAGRSLADMLFADKSGRVNPARDHVLVGKERTDVGRPHDWGYPIRGIVQDDKLYLYNFEPTRWPAEIPRPAIWIATAGPPRLRYAVRAIRLISRNRQVPFAGVYAGCPVPNCDVGSGDRQDVYAGPRDRGSSDSVFLLGLGACETLGVRVQNLSDLGHQGRQRKRFSQEPQSGVKHAVVNDGVAGIARDVEHL